MQILTDRHPVYVQKYNLAVSSLMGHTQWYYKMYSVLLPVCIVTTTVKEKCMHCGRVFGYDSNPCSGPSFLKHVLFLIQSFSSHTSISWYTSLQYYDYTMMHWCSETFSAFYNGVCSDCGLLGCDTVLSCRWVPMFPSSGMNEVGWKWGQVT